MKAVLSAVSHAWLLVLMMPSCSMTVCRKLEEVTAISVNSQADQGGQYAVNSWFKQRMHMFIRAKAEIFCSPTLNRMCHSAQANAQAHHGFCCSAKPRCGVKHPNVLLLMDDRNLQSASGGTSLHQTVRPCCDTICTRHAGAAHIACCQLHRQPRSGALATTWQQYSPDPYVAHMSNVWALHLPWCRPTGWCGRCQALCCDLVT
jgi:hypothetical protein